MRESPDKFGVFIWIVRLIFLKARFSDMVGAVSSGKWLTLHLVDVLFINLPIVHILFSWKAISDGRSGKASMQGRGYLLCLTSRVYADTCDT